MSKKAPLAKEQIEQFNKTDLWLRTISGLDSEYGRRQDLLQELERVVHRLAERLAEGYAEAGDGEEFIEEEGREGGLLTTFVRLAAIRDRLVVELGVDGFGLAGSLNPREFIRRCRANLTPEFCRWRAAQRQSA